MQINKAGNYSVVFQVGDGEDKATVFSKCKMSLSKQVSFPFLCPLNTCVPQAFVKKKLHRWVVHCTGIYTQTKLVFPAVLELEVTAIFSS